MHRVNLLKRKGRLTGRAMPISIPRLSVALLFAFTAFALWACGSTDFKGSAPGNPKDPKNLDIPKTVSPGEEGPLNANGSKNSCVIWHAQPSRMNGLSSKGLSPLNSI